MIPAVSANDPPRNTTLALRLLSCIRFDEVLALLGPPLMGAFISIGALTDRNLLKLGILVVAASFLVGHVFVVNDLFGIDSDLKDPNKASQTFSAKGASRTQMSLLSIALLASSLILFVYLSLASFVLALAIAGLSTLYSAPISHMKGVPIFSSILHLVGGSLHFLLGYVTFDTVGTDGFAISGFFALVFTAGHLTQEACDYEGDQISGIQTNAVAYGRTQTFYASFALFTAAYFQLGALASFGIVPHVLLFATALYPLHVIASWCAMRSGLGFDSLSRLRKRYRVLFAIIGVSMVSSVVMS